MAGIGYFGSLLFARQTFTIIQNEKLDLLQTMSLNDYPIGITVLDSFAQEFPEPDRIFEVTPIHTAQAIVYDATLNKNVSTTILKVLPVEKCDLKNNTYTKYKTLLANEDQIRGATCIPPGINLNITSPIARTTTEILSIVLRRCQNNTLIGKTNCLPPNEIEEKLQDIFIATFFVDFLFDHDDLDNPGRPYVRYETMHAGASPVVFRELFMDFKNVEYFSDINFLITNPGIKQYTIIDKAWERTTTLRQGVIPGAFSGFHFGYGNIKQVYNIRYYKLQNMLADLGGLVKALITILLNLNLYFSNKTFFNKVIDANINSLYIKKIRKSLSVDLIGGELKKRTLTTYDGKGKIKGSDADPHDQEFNTGNRPKDDDITYSPKQYDQGKNDLEQGSPKKLIQNNKTFVSEMGYASERAAINDDLTARCEVRNARPNSNVELVKLSNRTIEDDNREHKEEQLVANPPSVGLKNNKDRVFKNFQINLCGYLLPFCCFKKNSQTAKQLELHAKFKEIINGHMDILNISKKLHIVDKLNYVISGDKYRNLLERTINPYLYDGNIPSSSDIYQAREDIIAALTLNGK